jgi:hypothetical protein
MAKDARKQRVRLEESLSWRRFAPRVVISAVLTVLAVVPLLWLSGLIEHPEILWLPSKFSSGDTPYTQSRAVFLLVMCSGFAAWAWWKTMRHYRSLRAKIDTDQPQRRIH